MSAGAGAGAGDCASQASRSRDEAASSVGGGGSGAGGGGARLDAASRKAVRDLVVHFERLDDAVTSWCFAPCAAPWVADVAFYRACVAPTTFVNFHAVRESVPQYASARAAVLDVRRLFGNAIRYNWDPRPAADGRAFRSVVLACLQELYTYVGAPARRALRDALARDGEPFVPCWGAFPGALATFLVLEEFHAAHFVDTFPLYHRDGLNHPEEEYADPRGRVRPRGPRAPVPVLPRGRRAPLCLARRALRGRRGGGRARVRRARTHVQHGAHAPRVHGRRRRDALPRP